MNYLDAVQLCLRLYCTVDGVPKSLLPLSKETLSDVFSQLGSAEWVRDADVREVEERRHWIEVIATIFKNGPAVVDIERGEALARLVGFVHQKGQA